MMAGLKRCLWRIGHPPKSKDILYSKGVMLTDLMMVLQLRSTLYDTTGQCRRLERRALPVPTTSTRSCQRLIATNGVYYSETVLKETSVLQVTTSAANNNTPGSYCDTRASWSNSSRDMVYVTVSRQLKFFKSVLVLERERECGLLENAAVHVQPI